MDYAAWNDLIGRRFFNPDYKDRKVYLHVSEALLNALGEPFGVSSRDFVKAACSTADKALSGNICERAVSVSHNWRKRASSCPPYIGYLAFFVLAAGIDGDFAPNAYYPRLRKLLGESVRSGTYFHFERIQDLWWDLQQWSSVERRGELGLFDAFTPGRFIHVGMPIRQVILSESERKSLPKIFGDAGLRPMSMPSARYMWQCLSRFGEGRFRERTLKALRVANLSDEAALIVSVAIDELENWDGTDLEETGDGDAVRSTYGTLSLCLSVDEIRKRVRASIRCRAVQGFSDERITLIGEDGTFRCTDHGNGWSTPLRLGDAVSDFDLAHLDWLGPLKLSQPPSKQYTLPESKVRLFASGLTQGIGGYIEVQYLPENEAFLIAANRVCTAVVAEWGHTSCDGFRTIPLLKGLPVGWSLFEAERANSDRDIKQLLPIVSFPETTRIKLEGGIRDAGGAYFRFALPFMTLVRASSTTQVILNGKLLSIRSGQRYELGVFAEDSLELLIQLQDQGHLVRQQTVYIHSDEAALAEIDQPWIDRFGNSVDQGARTRVSGALVIAEGLESFVDWIEGGLGLEPLPIELEEQSPPVDTNIQVNPVDRARLLLTEWKAEILAEIGTGYFSRLSRSPKGEALSEGGLHYVRAVKTGDSRHYARAIKELTYAVSSEDPTVQAAASVLLLMSFLRTQRSTGGVSQWPPYAEKTVLALKQQDHANISPEGQLSLLDITPMMEDIEFVKTTAELRAGDHG